MIRLRQIKKAFQDKSGINEVLRGIDLDVMEGEFISIMGPSGAGKSLLLSVLGMYDSAWQGEYYFLDQAIHRRNPKQRGELNKRYVGFVFQQFHLLDDLTVAENLEIPLSYRDIRKSERAARRVTNGEIVTAKAVRADGEIELSDGRVLDKSFREFLPGYAVTSYGSQGRTVDYVLFSDSTVKAATNAQQWYVTISRGRRGVRIFTS